MLPEDPACAYSSGDGSNSQGLAKHRCFHYHGRVSRKGRRRHKHFFKDSATAPATFKTAGNPIFFEDTQALKEGHSSRFTADHILLEVTAGTVTFSFDDRFDTPTTAPDDFDEADLTVDGITTTTKEFKFVAASRIWVKGGGTYRLYAWSSERIFKLT